MRTICLNYLSEEKAGYVLVVTVREKFEEEIQKGASSFEKKEDFTRKKEMGTSFETKDLTIQKVIVRVNQRKFLLRLLSATDYY